MKFDDWLMLGVFGSCAIWVIRTVAKDFTKGMNKAAIQHIPLLDMSKDNLEKFTKIPNLCPYPQNDDLYPCTPARIIEIIGNNSGTKRYKVVLNTVAFEWVEGWPYVRGLGVGDLTCGQEGFLEWDEINGIYDEESGRIYRAPASIAEFLRLSVGGVVDTDFKKL